MLLYRLNLFVDLCRSSGAKTAHRNDRYGLLQKLGAKRKQINRTLFTQTAVFFAIPLTVAGIYSAFLIGKAMTIVEEFMNIHISTNIGLTIILFLIVYGSYFIATYLSCKSIVTEQKKSEV